MVTTTSSNSLMGVYRFLRDNGGELYAVYDVLSNVLGKRVVKTSAEGGPVIKRKGGLFSKDDEVVILRKFRQLDPDEQEILIGLLGYQFGPLDKPEGWLVAIFTFTQSNRWRSVIMDLDLNPHELGSKQIVSDAESETLKFLKSLVKIVRSEAEITEGTEEEKLQAGYKKAWEYMEALGLPTMSKEVLDMMAKINVSNALKWSKQKLMELKELIDSNFDAEKLAKWTADQTRPVRAHIRAGARVHRQIKAKREQKKSFFSRLWYFLTV